MTGAVKSPIVDGKRQCTRCLEVKPIGEFYPKNPSWRRDNHPGPSGHYSECKDCFRARQKKRYHTMFGFVAGLALVWFGAAEPAHSQAALCTDGTYSYSAHFNGTCSHHHGVEEWYDPYMEEQANQWCDENPDLCANSHWEGIEGHGDHPTGTDKEEEEDE